jgi:hypothetical protein
VNLPSDCCRQNLSQITHVQGLTTPDAGRSFTEKPAKMSKRRKTNQV